MDRAGRPLSPLSSDEQKKIWELMKRGVKKQEIRKQLPQRHPNTVYRAYNILREFEMREVTTIEDKTAQEIAEAAKYSATAKYVRDLFLLRQTWIREEEPAQPSMVGSNEWRWRPQDDPHETGLRRELERLVESSQRHSSASLQPTSEALLGWLANLREHTKALDFPRLLDVHAYLVADHQQVSKAARQCLDTLEAAVTSDLSSDIQFFHWSESILDVMVSRAFGGLTLWDPDPRIYKPSSPNGSGQVEIRWSEYSLTHLCALEYFDLVVSGHKELRRAAERLFPYLETTTRNVTKAASAVRQEALRLLRMSRIPGECNECWTPAIESRR